MLNWLHLTDLHWGLMGQKTLFPNVRDKITKALDHLLEKSGPWDVIFFTGDLVQYGKKEEFDDLEKTFLATFKKDLAKRLGYEPVMLAIPGNHDLDRSALLQFPATTRSLLDPNEYVNVSGQLFRSPEEGMEPESRLAISAAFRNYSNWWSAHVESTWGRDNVKRIGTRRLEVTKPRGGIMPGDFSATITIQSNEREHRKIGVVGLNTTFLQLAGGDFRGKLSWDPRQLNAVCDDDPPAWVKQHDACLLLTHQGPDWLAPEARGLAMYEINPPGRFAAHLFGHEHELLVESKSTLGGPLLNTWQGSSLFGLEHFGEGLAKADRRHGFSAGRLDSDQSELRIWPRKAVLVRGTGWEFVPDRECSLSEDESLRQPISQVRNTNWRAMDLNHAQADFTKELLKFGPQDEIVIHHLGPDMTMAKNRLIVMLGEELRVKTITIKLVMLSEQVNDYPRSTPPDVLVWAKNAPAAVEHIKKEINTFATKYKEQGRRLTLTTSPYAEVPTIHGFSLHKKNADGRLELIATYFAFCRWSVDHNTYEWGGSRYWKVSQDRRDRLSEDMSAIFEGAFLHLWETSKDKRSEAVRIGPTNG
jgi:hypothetical protein